MMMRKLASVKAQSGTRIGRATTLAEIMRVHAVMRELRPTMQMSARLCGRCNAKCVKASG